MTKIFWDSNLFIYLFEGHPLFMPLVADLRKRMVSRGDALYTGSLTVGEVLVKPYLASNSGLIARYESFFAAGQVTVLPFDLSAARHYAAIRRDKSISRPDAIQLACAAAGGMDLFVTNDAALHGKVIPGIKFLTDLSRAPL